MSILMTLSPLPAGIYDWAHANISDGADDLRSRGHETWEELPSATCVVIILRRVACKDLR